MQNERRRKCARRSTLAALPIRGLPFPDTQPSTQPAGSAGAKRYTSVSLAHRQEAGQRAVAEWLSPTSERGSSRKLADVSDNDDEKEAFIDRKSYIPSSGNLKPSAARNHLGWKLNEAADGDTVPEEMLHESEYGGSGCSKRTTRKGRPLSGGTSTTVNQPRWLGRTPSWPSSLIRVKERILEKVYVTSSEWPDAAAIEREKRQRAATAFMLMLQGGGSSTTKMPGESSIGVVGPGTSAAASAVIRLSPSATVPSNPPSRQQHPHNHQQQQQQQHVITDHRRRVRIQSEPQSTTTMMTPTTNSALLLQNTDGERSNDNRQSSKLAFRRRSISEETSDRPISRCRRGRSVNVATPGGGHGTRRGAGIVCSDDDLRAIVYEHRLRQSTSPSSTFVAESEFLPLEPKIGETVTFDLGSPCDNKQTYRYVTSMTPTLDDVTGSGHLAHITSGQYDEDMNSTTEQLLQPHCVVTSQPVCNAIAARKSSTGHLQPVPEVVFDEHGQTWDVYGAEFDPEILGLAIQVHLEKMMAASTQTHSPAVSSDGVKHEHNPLQHEHISHCRLIVSRDRRANRLVEFISRYLCSS